MRGSYLLAGVISLLAALPVAHGEGVTWPEHPSARALLEVIELVQSEFLYGNVDEGLLWRGAIEGVIAKIGDRWGMYESADDIAHAESIREGSAMGLGLALADIDPVTRRGTKVRLVDPGGPAERAGLRAGDVLLAVAGIDVRFMDAESSNDAIRRAGVGAVTEWLVARPGVREPVRLLMTPEDVKFEPARVVNALLAQEVGHVTIPSFRMDGVHFDVARALNAVEGQGATGIILDLRGNQGGYVREALGVAAEFLPDQDVLQVQDRRGSRNMRTILGTERQLPMVVLVNADTRSVAENLALVLQAHGKAVVVGENTMGKALGQGIYSLADGGHLMLTAMEFSLPDGSSLRDVGLQPDVPTPDVRDGQRTIFAAGTGTREGQVVELYVDGQLVASGVAHADGFDLVAAVRDPQGECRYPYLPELVNDAALCVAYETLLGLRDSAVQAAYQNRHSQIGRAHV